MPILKLLPVAAAFVLSLTMGFTAEASVRSFRIYSFRQVTSQVDRLYGTDGGAFATMFCRSDAAEVMFVDSRVPELDGISFVFASIEACNQARATIRKSYRKCVTELQLEPQTRTAQVVATKCH